MQVEVKCPECGAAFSIKLEDATWEIKCKSCSRYFIPVEDSEVSCPQCGSIVVIPRGGSRKKVSCLACGLDFRHPTGQKLPKDFVLLAAAVVGAFALLVIIFAVGRSELRGGCSGLFGSRRSAANENAATATLRTMCSAEEVFWAKFGNYATLTQLAGARLIDTSLAGATHKVYARAGYYYIHKTDGVSWCCSAMPAAPGLTGSRSFFIGADGVIYWAPCKTENDPPAGKNNSPLGM